MFGDYVGQLQMASIATISVEAGGREISRQEVMAKLAPIQQVRLLSRVYRDPTVQHPHLVVHVAMPIQPCLSSVVRVACAPAKSVYVWWKAESVHLPARLKPFEAGMLPVSKAAALAGCAERRLDQRRAEVIESTASWSATLPFMCPALTGGWCMA